MKILIAFLAVALLYGCTGSPPEDGNNASAITKAICEKGGGYWNECGSACRGAPPGTACPAMCVSYCECGGIAGFSCPAGYVCTDYLPSNDTPDAMGICKKVSE